MRHSDYDFLDAVPARVGQQLIEQRNRAFAAFQRKTLLADILGMQIFFERASCHQAIEQPAFFCRSKYKLTAQGFEPLLNPAFLCGLHNVHVFRADGAAIRRSDDFDYLTQRSGRRVESLQGSGVEQALHIVCVEAVKCRIEFGDVGPRVLVERIEAGLAVPHEAIGIDQL